MSSENKILLELHFFIDLKIIILTVSRKNDSLICECALLLFKFTVVQDEILHLPLYVQTQLYVILCYLFYLILFLL